jgi:hypothetical protein
MHRLHVSARSHHQAFTIAETEVLYYWDPKSLQYWSILLTCTLSQRYKTWICATVKA